MVDKTVIFERLWKIFSYLSILSLHHWTGGPLWFSWACRGLFSVLHHPILKHLSPWLWLDAELCFNDEALNYFQSPFSHLYHNPQQKFSTCAGKWTCKDKGRSFYTYETQRLFFPMLSTDWTLIRFRLCIIQVEIVWSLGVSAKLRWLNHLVNILVINTSWCWYWQPACYFGQGGFVPCSS